MRAQHIIRLEHDGDADAISDVIRQAFATHPHSSRTEHFIVNALRRANALTLSLVAEQAGQVIGHIAFSPVTIADGAQGWFGLGPVSVSPSFRKQGIGKQLVELGLLRLRAQGAAGCVVVGDPMFYGRFGFINQPQLTLPGVPQDVFLALSFDGSTPPVYPRGEVTYDAAFFAKD